MLNHIERYRNGTAYRGIFREFVALTANVYPELFDVKSLLLCEGKDMAAQNDLNLVVRR